MAKADAQHKSLVKETLISITIAFALAFVFRAFVIEAFVIPTGSMAPTLMGAHVRFTSRSTGNEWPVDAWQKTGDTPNALQKGLTVTDRMSGQPLQADAMPTRAGDRILVFKYLYSVYDPQRFDVVVFKSPEQPATNFIKRLIGMPGEQVALVDGDVFARRPRADDLAGQSPWLLDGWAIQRKPLRVQHAVWQTLFSSDFAPIGPGTGAWRAPWNPGPGDEARWTIGGARTYHFEGGQDKTLLWWDNSSFTWAIDDYYSYNEKKDDYRTFAPEPPYAARRFPVSDVRMTLGFRPAAEGQSVTAVLRARGHDFRGRLGQGRATVQMRRHGESLGDEEGWQTLGEGEAGELLAGRTHDIEFWHVDQSVSLWVAGQRVAYGEYDWQPDERVRRVVGRSVGQIINAWEENRGRESGNPLADPSNYERPVVTWQFSGASAGFALERVALARDLHYQAANYSHNIYTREPAARAGQPANATHPLQTPTLGPDHFFVCGDNSPASSDARLWDTPDPAVAQTIDPTIGVVPRDLMIGKAFFVYFPSLLRGERVPVPDFGRMRWIW